MGAVIQFKTKENNKALVSSTNSNAKAPIYAFITPHEIYGIGVSVYLTPELVITWDKKHTFIYHKLNSTYDIVRVCNWITTLKQAHEYAKYMIYEQECAALKV